MRNDSNGQPITQCDAYSGECQCRDGRGGKNCDQCQTYFWGDPKQDKCESCDCNPQGSMAYQCNYTTGNDNSILVA